AILSTLPETRQKAVRGRENKDVAADAVLSGYEMRNQAPAEQDGSGRIAKIFICTVLGASAAWFCRQNWGHVESAMADIQAGVRYSAVPCDGENLLTVEPEESARPAPLRGGDQEQVSWLHLCIARLQGMVQRWSPSRYPIVLAFTLITGPFILRCSFECSFLRSGARTKDDPRTPEEKQGLLGPWEDEEEGQSDVSTVQTSPLFHGDEDSMAAIMKLRPSVNDSVGDEEEVDSARPIIGSEREELLSR
ncbi:unnamed protein product, partial [Cladocopium goreaui]